MITCVAEMLADFGSLHDVLQQEVGHRLLVLRKLLQRRPRQLVEGSVGRNEDGERLRRRVEPLVDVGGVDDGVVKSVEPFVG